MSKNNRYGRRITPEARLAGVVYGYPFYVRPELYWKKRISVHFVRPAGLTQKAVIEQKWWCSYCDMLYKDLDELERRIGRWTS